MARCRTDGGSLDRETIDRWAGEFLPYARACANKSPRRHGGFRDVDSDESFYAWHLYRCLENYRGPADRDRFRRYFVGCYVMARQRPDPGLPWRHLGEPDFVPFSQFDAPEGFEAACFDDESSPCPVSRALASMDPTLAEVLVLRHVEGLSWEVMARRTRISAPRLHRLLAEARELFVRTLDELSPGYASQCLS